MHIDPYTDSFMNADLFTAGAQQPVTVSQLTGHIKAALETAFDRVAVVGEISNFKRHAPSGHAYFSLKDESATISAVMWRSRIGSLFFTPADGMKVIAQGRITVYPPRGNYQIDVTSMQPAGMGELQIAFEKLKQKLLDEGLFDAAHKKPLPRYPSRIGIVTSETGAAFRDIVTVIRRRYPPVELLLLPVRVQGSGAAGEIARGIRDLNRYGTVDVIIAGRGGGSLEDLWPFNEEIVARAIFESEIPVVSAVGHEVDYSIADLVADLRAPTPSAAAEIVVPDRREMLEIIDEFAYTLHRRVFDLVSDRRDSIHRLLKTYSFNRPYDLLRSFSQRVDDLDRRLKSKMTHRLEVIKTESRSLGQRLEALDPERVVNRGYAIVYNGNEIMETSGEVRARGQGVIRLKDGRIGFTVRGK
jgi:exodeoxyribonuclease VII large subunit